MLSRSTVLMMVVGKMKIKNLQDTLKKTHGDTFVTEASDLGDVARLPIGLYDFDSATGGGFPRGKLSILWGRESTGKTNLLLLAIAANQRLEPDKKNVFLDIEHSFDKKWASLLGVDVSSLVLFKPDYGEQAVDIIQACMTADDVGVIGIDSIAALIPTNEQDSTAEKAQVGGNALLISKLMKKSVLELSKASRRGSYPTIIAINQYRLKIGVMFGNPETQPGGNALRHTSGLTIHMRGKDIIDKSVDDKRPAFKEMRGKIEKYKVPILYNTFEMMMPVINKGGLSIGKVDSWKKVLNQLKDLGWIYKEGSKVRCLDMVFPTYTAVKEHFDKNPDIYAMVRGYLVDALMKEMYGSDDDDEEVDEEE